MPRIKLSTQLSLPEAIRRGKMEDVLLAIEDGLSGRIELTNEEDGKWPSDNGFMSAFEYAIARKRWPIAIALMHAPEDYLDKGSRDLPEKRAIAFFDLMTALDDHRRDNALPARLYKQILTSWLGFDQALQGLKGPAGEDAQSIFRVKSVAFQPPWLRLVPFMLHCGVSPNQSAVSPEGYVSTLLRASAIRGFGCDVQALLAAGADPLFKMHDGSLAAHDAADLARLPPDAEPGEPFRVPSLDHIRSRRECFLALNAIPGVAAAINWHGKTPEKSWQDSMVWLSQQQLPDDPVLCADYQSRKLDIITGLAAPATPRPRM